MCYMLIFFKSKNNYFSKIFDIVFELFKNSPLHPNQVRGLILDKLD